MSDGKINNNFELKNLNLDKKDFTDKEKINDEKLIEFFEGNGADNLNSDNITLSPKIIEEPHTLPLIFERPNLIEGDLDDFYNKLMGTIDDNEANEDDGGINSTTNERQRQERINNLDGTEAAVYAQYQSVIDNLEDGENVNDAIFEFMDGLSDEELASFLQAYDYVNDGDGGMEALISKLFNECIVDECKDIDMNTLSRLDKLLSDNDKQSILDYYEKQNEHSPVLDRNLSALEYLINGNSNKAKDILFNHDDGSINGEISGISSSPSTWEVLDPEIFLAPKEEENNNDDDGINSSTNERIKQERINNLNETEAAVYAQYQSVIDNLEDGENVYDAIFEFMDGLSDEELASFLQAYDYVNDEDGGMEELVSKLFNELLADSGKDIDVNTLVRLDKLLSDSDKKAILDYYKKEYNVFPGSDRNLSALEYLLNGNSNKALDILYNHDEANIHDPSSWVEFNPSGIAPKKEAPSTIKPGSDEYIIPGNNIIEMQNKIEL